MHLIANLGTHTQFFHFLQSCSPSLMAWSLMVLSMPYYDCAGNKFSGYCGTDYSVSLRAHAPQWLVLHGSFSFRFLPRMHSSAFTRQHLHVACDHLERSLHCCSLVFVGLLGILFVALFRLCSFATLPLRDFRCTCSRMEDHCIE